MAYIGATPTAVPLTGADIEDGTIQIADLSATGTKDATTFLRGDGTFASAGLTQSDIEGLDSSAKAWVQFDGTAATVSVDAGYNVSSITDHGGGTYTINFTNAFEDAEYCGVYGNRSILGQFHWIAEDGNTAVRSTTAVRITIAKHDNSTATDSAVVSAAFFR